MTAFPFLFSTGAGSRSGTCGFSSSLVDNDVEEDIDDEDDPDDPPEHGNGCNFNSDIFGSLLNFFPDGHAEDVDGRSSIGQRSSLFVEYLVDSGGADR